MRLSKKFPFVYSAGKEGSLFVWSYGKVDEEQMTEKPEELKSVYDEVEGLEELSDEDVPNYQKVLEDE